MRKTPSWRLGELFSVGGLASARGFGYHASDILFGLGLRLIIAPELALRSLFDGEKLVPHRDDADDLPSSLSPHNLTGSASSNGGYGMANKA